MAEWGTGEEGLTDGLTDGALHFVTQSKVIGSEEEEEREKAERKEGLAT